MIEPLPSAGISRMLSVCEVLEDHDGQEDLGRLGEDLHVPVAELLLCLRGAELLGLVEVVRGRAQLLPLGQKVLQAGMAEKKALLKQQMLALAMFEHVLKMLENADGHELPAMVILEWLALCLPQEEPRQVLTTLLNWGRYGEVFGYSRESDRFFLSTK